MGLLDSVFGSIFGTKDARDTNRANKDIAEVNTLTSGIQELFNEIESTLSTDQLAQFQEALTSIERVRERTTGTETTAQDRASAEASEQQRRQQQTGEITRGTETGQDALEQLIAELGGAGTDTGAAVDAAIRRVLESGAPQISNVLTQSGSFNNTTAALLQNDLITRAADAAAGIDLQQQNVQTQQLLDAITAGQAGTETTSQDLEEAVRGETTATEALTGTTETAQETDREAATDTTRTGEEQTTTTEQETTTEAQTGVTQEFKDVSDVVAPASGSDLAALVELGRATDPTLGLNVPEGEGAIIADTGADVGVLPSTGQGSAPTVGNGSTGGEGRPTIQRSTARDVTQTPPINGPVPSLDGVLSPDDAASTLLQIQASREGEGAGTDLEDELQKLVAAGVA